MIIRKEYSIFLFIIAFAACSVSCRNSVKRSDKGNTESVTEADAGMNNDTLKTQGLCEVSDEDVLLSLPRFAMRMSNIAAAQEITHFAASKEEFDTVHVRLDMLYGENGNSIEVEKSRKGEPVFKRVVLPEDLAKADRNYCDDMKQSDIIKGASIKSIYEYADPKSRERYGNSINVRVLTGTEGKNIGSRAAYLTIDDVGHATRLFPETVIDIDFDDDWIRESRSQLKDSLYVEWSKGMGMRESERYYTSKDSSEVYVDVLRNGLVSYKNDYEYYFEMSCKVEWYSKGKPIIPARTIVIEDLVRLAYPDVDFKSGTYPGIIDVWVKNANAENLSLIALVGRPGYGDISALDVDLDSDGRLEATQISFPETAQLDSSVTRLKLCVADNLPDIGDIESEQIYKGSDTELRVVTAGSRCYLDLMYVEGEGWPYLELSSLDGRNCDLAIVQAEPESVEVLLNGIVYSIYHQSDSAAIRARNHEKAGKCKSLLDKINFDDITLPEPTQEFAELAFLQYGDSVSFQSFGQTEEIACTLVSRSDNVNGMIIEVCDTSVVYLKQVNTGKLHKEEYGSYKTLYGESRCYVEWYINGECVLPCKEITVIDVEPGATKKDIMDYAYVCESSSGEEIALIIHVGMPDSDLISDYNVRITRDGSLYSSAL